MAPAVAADFTNTFRSLASVQPQDDSDSLPGPLQAALQEVNSCLVYCKSLQDEPVLTGYTVLNRNNVWKEQSLVGDVGHGTPCPCTIAKPLRPVAFAVQHS